MKQLDGNLRRSWMRSPRTLTPALSRTTMRGRMKERRGTVLIVTMGIVFILASLVLVFSRSMQVEALRSANQVAAIQAGAAERGAEQYVMATIVEQGQDVLTASDDTFAAVPVGEGYFWVIKPDYNDQTQSNYGVVDEASKLNVNTAAPEMLLGLPVMTDELAAAIVDWRDSDENISPNGAESEYYMSLNPPYQCKNGPLETVEELLLVRDFSTDLLYGSMETGIQTQGPTSKPTWPPTPVLYDYLTVYSNDVQTVLAADAVERVNVNGTDGQAVVTMLVDALGSGRANELAGRIRPRPAFQDVFDFQFRVGLTDDEFAKVAGQIVTTTQPSSALGRINVATAPEEVLLCLPNLDQADVDNLITRREDTALDKTNLAWVSAALGQKAVGLGNMITSVATQYSADIVAVSGDGRAFRRCRIVIDISKGTPQIIYRRDLSDWGWPLDKEILTSLRTGQGVPGAAQMTSRRMF